MAKAGDPHIAVFPSVRDLSLVVEFRTALLRPAPSLTELGRHRVRTLRCRDTLAFMSSESPVARPWKLVLGVGVPFWIYAAVSRSAAMSVWFDHGALASTVPSSVRIMQHLLLLPVVLLLYRLQLRVGLGTGRRVKAGAFAFVSAAVVVFLARPALLVSSDWLSGTSSAAYELSGLVYATGEVLSQWMLAYSEFALNYLLGAALILGIDVHLRLRLETERRITAESAWRAARLEALRSRFDPHFLYNTLNTIASLADHRPTEVRGVVVQLSDLLRQSMSESSQEYRSLASEFRYLDSYLAIQRARFGERLQVTTDIEPAARAAFVPSLLLQPLIENAVRHGLAGGEGTVHILIRAELTQRLLVRIANSCAPAGAALPSASGLGLRLTRERLEALYGTSASLTVGRPTPTSYEVTVELPLEQTDFEERSA